MTTPSSDQPTANASPRLVPYFLPWKGVNYEAGYKGHKLLILGESHYEGVDADTPALTNYVLKKHISGEEPLPFFKKIEQLVNGRAIPANES